MLRVLNMGDSDDLIPKSFEELEELHDYSIINNKEFYRLSKIMSESSMLSSTDSSDSPDSQLGVIETLAPISAQLDTSVFKEGTTDIIGKNGIITRTIQYINADKQKIRIVQKVKRTTRTTLVPKRVMERRKLAKFGKCENYLPGPEVGVTSYGETVRLKLASESETEKPLDKEGSDTPNRSMIACRRCKQSGHWTMKCPYTDETLKTLNMINDSEKKDISPDSEKGKYVPPWKRIERGDMDLVPTAASKTNIRVSNLDEEATDDDLRNLFGKFGSLKRSKVITDRKTEKSRGFAYVDFEDEEDAQAAMGRLHRYAYGKQILELSWAKPRRKVVPH